MSAYVILNLLNELGKKEIKCQTWRKNVIICHYVRNIGMDVIMIPKNL